MISLLEKGVSEMKTEGFDFMSVSIGIPKGVVSAGSKLLAVVPMSLKMKGPGGVLTQESFWLGVADGDGKGWTFISGAELDEQSMKIVTPEAVGKISLPPKKEPVFERVP